MDMSQLDVFLAGRRVGRHPHDLAQELNLLGVVGVDELGECGFDGHAMARFVNQFGRSTRCARSALNSGGW